MERALCWDRAGRHRPEPRQSSGQERARTPTLPFIPGASRLACPGTAFTWHRPQGRHAPSRPLGPLAGRIPAPYPRAGLIYSLTDAVDLYGNISKLYEAPTNYELEDDARGGIATLDAMTGQVAEIGTRGSHHFGPDDFWNWDVSLYYAAIQDEILSQDDPNAPGTSLTVNVDDTIHAGIEALVGGSFTLGAGRIEPLVSFTLNEFSFDDDTLYGNNSLPAAPGYVIHGEILYRSSNGFFAGPTFDVVDERYADFLNSYKVDSYNLLGFRAGLNRENWQAFIEFKNLTDEEYVSTFSVINQYGPDSAIFNTGEPRALYAGVQFRL